jgi:hypothetical protein
MGTTVPSMTSPVPFRDLPRPTQREVEKLARKGKAHPEPAVAAAAHVWAQEVRERHKRVPGAGGVAFMFDLAISSVLGVVTGMVSGQQLAERRLAKQLIKLQEQPGCGYCQEQGNRPYHLEQLADRPGASDLLMRCPRCSTLWELPAVGRGDAPLTLEEARERYPNALLDE